MSVTTDKQESAVSMDLGVQTAQGLVAVKNIFAQIEARWPGQTPDKHKVFFFLGQTVPDNTDYPDTIAPIGSLFIQIGITTGAVAGATMYLKTAAATWTVIGGVAAL